MLRGIVFDFDGVIVDSHPMHKRAWKKFLESVGRVVSEEDLQFVLDGRRRDEILQHYLGQLDYEQMVEYGEKKEQFFRDEATSVQTVSGVLDFLQELDDAQLALAIASSGSRSRVNLLLGRLDLARHFQVVVTGDDVEKAKPDPAVFLRAAQRLQMDPAEIIVFEDAASGVTAAKAAGMMCVGVAQPDYSLALLDAGADHVVQDFRSLTYLKIQELFHSTSQETRHKSAQA